MKKIFVLLAGLCICGVAAAQPSKGEVILKGSIGYNTLGAPAYTQEGWYDQTSLSYTSALNLWSINPRLEYFVGDRSSVGISVSYINAWQKEKATLGDGFSKHKTGISLFYVGPTYNYYVRLAERFYLSVNCFIGYASLSSWYKEKSSGGFDNIDEKNSTGGSFGLLTVTPTLNYFINDRWLLTASVGSLAGAYGKLPGSDSDTYYAGANWGNIMFGVGFKF